MKTYRKNIQKFEHDVLTLATVLDLNGETYLRENCLDWFRKCRDTDYFISEVTTKEFKRGIELHVMTALRYMCTDAIDDVRRFGYVSMVVKEYMNDLKRLL